MALQRINAVTVSMLSASQNFYSSHALFFSTLANVPITAQINNVPSIIFWEPSHLLHYSTGTPTCLDVLKMYALFVLVKTIVLLDCMGIDSNAGIWVSPAPSPLQCKVQRSFDIENHRFDEIIIQQRDIVRVLLKNVLQRGIVKDNTNDTVSEILFNIDMEQLSTTRGFLLSPGVRYNISVSRCCQVWSIDGYTLH